MQFYRITTDDTLRETVQHGSLDFPFAYYVDDIWKYDFHYIDWHWHHEIEIVSSTKGTIICLIGSEEVILEEGSSVFINSGVMHRFETTNGAIMPNIVFNPSLLAPENSLVYEKYIRPFLQSGITHQVLKPDIEWQNQILQTLFSIYEDQEHTESSELYTLQLLLQLWNILIKNINVSLNLQLDQTRNLHQIKL